jgi:hypothetical protein
LDPGTFHCQVQRRDSHDREERQGQPAGAVGEAEFDDLAGRGIEGERLPDEGVVQAELVRARGDVPDHRLAEEKCRDAFAVQVDVDLPLGDVDGQRPGDDEPGRYLTGRSVRHGSDRGYGGHGLKTPEIGVRRRRTSG